MGGINLSALSLGGGEGGSGSGIAKYPSAASLPVSAADGDVAIVLDTNVLYSYDSGVGAWVVIGGPGVAVTASDSESITVDSATNNWTFYLNIGSSTLPANTQGISLLVQPTGNTGLYGYFPAGPISEVTSSILQFSGPGRAVGFSFGIQVNQASGSTPGYLSAADWTSFNNKIAGISTVLNTVFPILGGTNLPTLGGITLTIPVANGSTGGYLSATDWTIFNAKLSVGASIGQLGNIAANSFLGNNTGGAGPILALTVAQAKTALGISNNNFGDVSLGAFLAATSTVGATISLSQVLAFTEAQTTNPGMVSPNAQAWNGIKTFNSDIIAMSYLRFAGASQISIGSSATTGYTLLLPLTQGSTQTLLKNNGLGELSWGRDGTIGGDFLLVSAGNGTATTTTRFIGVTTTTTDRAVAIDLLAGLTGVLVTVQKLDSGLGNVLVGATSGINGASIMILSGQWSKMQFISTGSGFYA